MSIFKKNGIEYHVTDKNQAAAFRSKGWVEPLDPPVPPDDQQPLDPPVPPDGAELDKWLDTLSRKEVDSYAQSIGIDTSEVRKKPDAIAMILAAGS